MTPHKINNVIRFSKVLIFSVMMQDDGYCRSGGRGRLERVSMQVKVRDGIKTCEVMCAYERVKETRCERDQV